MSTKAELKNRKIGPDSKQRTDHSSTLWVKDGGQRYKLKLVTRELLISGYTFERRF